MSKLKAILAAGAAFLGMASSGAMAQYPIGYEGCGPLQSSDFEANVLLSHTTKSEGAVKHESLHNLIRFDLLKNGDDYDIFYGGFEGVLYRYNAQSKEITTIKNFNTIQGSVGAQYNQGDHGLTGIAFHPNFEENRWLFVFYTPKVSGNQNRVMRLSRFEMSESYELQNEKVLLSMEATTTDQWHSGGDMYFTAQGDLFLQVGDNVADDTRNDSRVSNAAWSSANTANLLGGVVRIHPDSSDVGYAIPKNNFGEYFAPIENNPDYMDTAHVKPEIFAKGQRSNFTATGHPTELIHIWGEVCTDNRWDEINVVNTPVFSGWPFYQGNESLKRTGGSNNRYSHNINDNPVITDVVGANLMDPNSLLKLPKVYQADLVMDTEFNVVMAQALYFYGKGDAIVPGRTFPPNFHETFMFSKRDGFNARIVPIIKNGDNVTAELKDESYEITSLLAQDRFAIFNTMTEAKYGPDGALYIMARGGEYNSPKGMITRIDYKGDCQDPDFFAANHAEIQAAKSSSGNLERYREDFYDPMLYTVGIKDSKFYLNLNAGDKISFDVVNIQGQKLGTFSTQVNGKNKLPLWDGMLASGKKAKSGIYILRYKNLSNGDVFSRTQAL